MIATGHSLGSALATEALVAHPDKIEKAYIFGRIGVNPGVAKKYDKMVKEKEHRLFAFTDKDDNLRGIGYSYPGTEFLFKREFNWSKNEKLLPKNERNAWKAKSRNHRLPLLSRSCLVYKQQGKNKLPWIVQRAAFCILFPLVAGGLAIKRMLLGRTSASKSFQESREKLSSDQDK